MSHPSKYYIKKLYNGDYIKVDQQIRLWRLARRKAKAKALLEAPPKSLLDAPGASQNDDSASPSPSPLTNLFEAD